MLRLVRKSAAVAVLCLAVAVSGCDKTCGECGSPTSPTPPTTPTTPSAQVVPCTISYEMWTASSTGGLGTQVEALAGGASGGRLDFSSTFTVNRAYVFVYLVDCRPVFDANQQAGRLITVQVNGPAGSAQTTTRQEYTLQGGRESSGLIRFQHGFFPRSGDNVFAVTFDQTRGNLPANYPRYTKNVNARAR